MKNRNLILTSLFTSLIIIGTFIKIPLPVCPITLQPLFVCLSGLFLGSLHGAASVICYIALGLLGLPVFAMGGGFGCILNPTFGFIIGFVLQSLVTGLIVRKGSPTIGRMLAGCFSGLVIMYAVGLVYFMFISRFYLGKLDIQTMLVSCLLIPFPKDAAMCVFAAFLGRKFLKSFNSFIIQK
ncbi:MAG: biotin transporter BioY [Ruminococcus sp.]|nr:biotin transporter BioY [Ruminococcus sp.]